LAEVEDGERRSLAFSRLLVVRYGPLAQMDDVGTTSALANRSRRVKMKNARIVFSSALIVAGLVSGCQSPPSGQAPPASPTSAPAAPAAQPAQAEPPAANATPMTAPEAKAADADTAPLTMSAMDMQKRLTELGYKPGPVDGKPGPRTTNALRKFQHDHKLAVTGTLDEETIRALQRP
jgi:hypothetical protein